MAEEQQRLWHDTSFQPASPTANVITEVRLRCDAWHLTPPKVTAVQRARHATLTLARQQREGLQFFCQLF